VRFYLSEEYTFAMTERSTELLQKALSLTEKERAGLAASLLNSLDSSQDPDAEALWQEEISRRASALDSGESRTIPWDEVQSQVSAALQHGPKKR
jgi:putative addiction module component (TIGR02574 family)